MNFHVHLRAHRPPKFWPHVPAVALARPLSRFCAGYRHGWEDNIKKDLEGRQ